MNYLDLSKSKRHKDLNERKVSDPDVRTATNLHRHKKNDDYIYYRGDISPVKHHPESPPRFPLSFYQKNNPNHSQCAHFSSPLIELEKKKNSARNSAVVKLDSNFFKREKSKEFTSNSESEYGYEYARRELKNVLVGLKILFLLAQERHRENHILRDGVHSFLERYPYVLKSHGLGLHSIIKQDLGFPNEIIPMCVWLGNQQQVTFFTSDIQ